jgi:endonuclease/exonuclease/phosphatase (EEP) superfamily protein YafD
VLVGIWFALWLIMGDGPWWLTVLNRIVPYLFLPVPLFLMGLARNRHYKLTALFMLPVSMFVFLYHPYVLPRYFKPAIAQSELSVMTYNVLYSNLDYDAVANVILTYHPDLVALQEVVPNMMSALDERLAEEYPYSVHGTNKDYGVTAVYSRHPLLETYVLELSGNHRPVIVKAQVRDQTVIFTAVHLSAYGLQWVKLPDIPQAIVDRTNAQNQQVELLLRTLQGESGPVIIGCDCNSKETSSSYRMLDEWFDSAAYQVGWQVPGIDLAGARQDTNMQHIDYIWYRGALDPVASYVIHDTGGSDHHPVLARFEFR